MGSIGCIGQDLIVIPDHAQGDAENASGPAEDEGAPNAGLAGGEGEKSQGAAAGGALRPPSPEDDAAQLEAALQQVRMCVCASVCVGQLKDSKFKSHAHIHSHTHARLHTALHSAPYLSIQELTLTHCLF